MIFNWQDRPDENRMRQSFRSGDDIEQVMDPVVEVNIRVTSRQEHGLRSSGSPEIKGVAGFVFGRLVGFRFGDHGGGLLSIHYRPDHFPDQLPGQADDIGVEEEGFWEEVHLVEGKIFSKNRSYECYCYFSINPGCQFLTNNKKIRNMEPWIEECRDFLRQKNSYRLALFSNL